MKMKLNPTTTTPPTVLMTRDLGQIIALVLSGVEPMALHRGNGHVVGHFPDDEVTHAVLEQYLLDKLKFSPRAFLNLQRDLKAFGINGSQLTGA